MDNYEAYIDKLKQEIEERNKQKQIKAYEEFQAKRQAEQEKSLNESRQGYVIDKFVEEKHARGEIVDIFIQQHLDAKIVVARWVLVLAMAATALFKGQWALWIIFIVIYNIYVTKEREKAFKEDVRRHQKK